MRNKLEDLNNYLFMRIEAIGDEELTGEALADEMNRAKMTADLAHVVVNLQGLELKKAMVKHSMPSIKLPSMLKG